MGRWTTLGAGEARPLRTDDGSLQGAVLDVRAGRGSRTCNYYHVLWRYSAKDPETTGMTDDAWRYDRRGVGAIADLVEPCSSRGKMGRPVKNDRRAVLDAIFHVAATSCQWRALPEKHPHWSTCHRYHHSRSRDGTWERVCDLLRSLVREKQERGADPSAGVIDARSVRGASTVGAATRDHDAGKKVNGRKVFCDGGFKKAFAEACNLGGAQPPPPTPPQELTAQVDALGGHARQPPRSQPGTAWSR